MDRDRWTKRRSVDATEEGKETDSGAFPVEGRPADGPVDGI